MRILPPIEEKIRREIRDARAIDPLISVVDLQDVLETRLNRTFTRKYIARIADKVARQGLTEADRTTIAERFNFTRENYRMMRERLLKIIYWEPDPELPNSVLQRPPLNKDVIEAAKNLVMMDLALLQAEAAAGMYKKPIEELAKTLHYEPVPGEIRTVIIASWARGGLLPAATVEKMVPLQEHAGADVLAA